MISDQEWQALCDRRPGPGVYAVITTGIYCRTGCPARLPLRHNVLMFETPDQARASGFRACKRCGGQPTSGQSVSRVECAIMSRND